MSTRRRLYFAGPLFNSAERFFNEQLTATLEEIGFDVFLPQRDGAERDREAYESMAPDERQRTIFELDRDKVFECDVFLFVLDGRVPDEGACVELGLAYADKLRRPDKLLIGLHTDARAAFMGAKLNSMIRVPLEFIAESEDELIAHLQASQ